MPLRQNRPPPAIPPALEVGSLRIVPQDSLAWRGRTAVPLTPTQLRLLVALVRHPDRLLTRAWLRRQVWRQTAISPRSIDAQISKLRRLLPELDSALRSLYGRGYLLLAGPHPRDRQAGPRPPHRGKRARPSHGKRPPRRPD